MDIPDSIRRELTLAAPRGRVWLALTDAERFVFRWRPQGSDRPYTRVTVTLADLPDGGTSLVLVEDGFAALAEHDEAIGGHTQGWIDELEELRALVETRAA